MRILNYTTTVKADKTISEIWVILRSHGAMTIITRHDDQGNVTALEFEIRTPHGLLPFRLPADPEAVLETMDEAGLQPRYLNIDHARDVAWRILKDWLEAQLALIQTSRVPLEKIFLPYLRVDTDHDLYSWMLESGGFKALTMPKDGG